ncbi:MAG: hypothetical protein IT170_11910 [Bryobacterales bacterium]|nr:hypothetical protein [Bryobacterales bacterium]
MSSFPVNHLEIPPEVIDLRAPSSAETQAHREALHRVLESASFRKSPRLREFLRFVGTQSLSGNDPNVSEQQIGIHVFQLGPDFSPAENNIVRATARALRTKLREYYDAEGALDTFRMEMPKGSYILHFEARAEIHPSQGAGDTGRRVLSLRAVIGVTAACLAVLLIGYLILENRRLSAEIAAGAKIDASTAGESLLNRVLGPHATVAIIGSDALHMQLQISKGRLSSLSDYTSKSIFEAPGALAGAPKLFDVIRELPLTNGNDVRAAVQLARSIPSDSDVRVIHARNVNMNTFERGGDFIILGGRRANPWVALFEKDLQFAMEYADAISAGIFRNRAPKKGEQPEYRAHAKDAQNGVAYGRVAILPGLYGSGKVVLIAGTSGESTFAASEFLTRPRGLKQVEGLLGGNIGGNLTRLEVLLETATVAGSTRDYRIVAAR